MLPIEELVRFGRGLDADYRHPVATAIGEQWGTEPPLFVRSSATHVFVANRGDGGRLVLRLRPDGAADVLARAAAAATAWNGAGGPMVASVPSLDGRMVEVVDGFAAMALEVVEGPTLEEVGDDLVDHAADWGEALARLHAVGPEGSELPVDTELPLPRTPDVFGVLHGDPEADNVVLGDRGLRFVDPDEVHLGWFAADIAFALRDWAPPGGPPDLSAEVPRRFVEGYRRVRPLSEDELSWLPLLARESARRELSGHERHLAAGPGADWPEWAVRLERGIGERADALRASLAAPLTASGRSSR